MKRYLQTDHRCLGKPVKNKMGDKSQPYRATERINILSMIGTSFVLRMFSLRVAVGGEAASEVGRSWATCLQHVTGLRRKKAKRRNFSL